ncbi:MAG: hypothetical protein ACE366_25815 [Bradymonadia bacterium]
MQRLQPQHLQQSLSRARWGTATPEITLRATWGDEDDLRSVTRFQSAAPEPVSYTYARDDGFEFRAEARWRPGGLIYSDQETQLIRERRLIGARRDAVITEVTRLWIRREQSRVAWQSAEPAQRQRIEVEIEALDAQLQALAGEEAR